MQILFKRGNTAQNDAYTGPLGSISIDVQARKFRIHDGVTAGGKIVPNMDDLGALSDALGNISIGSITGLQAALDAKANAAHSHTIANVTGLQAALDAKIASTARGSANGVASLDAQGKVPAAQLPSYVDDVEEYPELVDFPVTGETGKLYLAIDTNNIYRWSGSVYVHINASAGSADTATKLAAARTIAASGDAVWSVSFDGSTNATAALTLATTGVSAGTYRSVTVDTKGRVTAGTNPTTLSGYGITDAAPSSHVGSGGSAHSVATTSASGFMSSADKTKLDSISTGANNYTLPVATSTILGGVKQGTGVTISVDGVISAAVTSVAGKTGAVVVTKADVGLTNVADYSVSTQAEAEIGTTNVKYMTPLRTIQTIEAGNFTLDAGTLA